jgi:CzcA family heavy metal efflux pump
MQANRTLMRWIVNSSLRFRFLVVAAAVAMMAVGTLLVPNMRVDAFPEFAPPQVEIQTTCLGLSTTDVESLVTIPLEQALMGMKGLEHMRSKSVPQLSSVQMIFSQGTDLFEARQLVQERLPNIQKTLPSWAGRPTMLPPVSATSRVMLVSMASKDDSLITLSMEAYWTIRARLLHVPGVANVAIWGERPAVMSVQVDPNLMKANQVTLDAVMEATANSVDLGKLLFTNSSVIGRGGFIEVADGQRLSVQHVLPIVAPADLARASVQASDGSLVQLGQIALVKEDHPPLVGDAVVGEGPGLLFVIEKLPGANTLQTISGVRDAFNALQPGLPNVTFDTTVFRQSDFIDTAVHNLTQALVLGFLLVVVILGFFLFEWRMALISLVTIPLSLMAAMLVLYLHGDTVNTMTLAGLVIGLGAVVDDAVIGVENILRRLRQHRRAGGTQPAAAIILEASLEVRSPIVYATLIIVAAAVPVFLLDGLTGAFFRPLAVSYTLAILASMGVALTVTPALALIMLRKAPVERHESPLTRWLQGRYTAGLSRIMNRPHPAYATFVAFMLIAILTLPFLGQSLFPAFKEHDFLVHWVTTPGTSVAEEVRMITLLSHDLQAIPGVRPSFGAHIGQALLGEEVVGVNFGESWISIDPNVDYDKTLRSIRAVLQSYPGLYRDVQTYLNERIEEVLTGAKEPIVVRIYGQDLGVLRGKAAELEHALAGIPGIADDHIDLQVDTPQVEVKVDLAKVARYGLKPGDVRRAASTLMAGEDVGSVIRDGKTYGVMVWSTPATRQSVASISDLLIDTPSGTPVRVGDVAKVSVQPVPNIILRDDGSRRIDVVATVRGSDLGSVVGDVNKVLAKFSTPSGYRVELLGEFKERQAAQGRLLGVAIVAGLVIFLLLQTSFGSWRMATLVFLTLPMALAGGVIAAWAGGGVISIGSLLGFFTVFGIAARNGILLINHCQHLERVEGEPFGPALVLRGARERLAPILMTSLATGLAVVPLVVLGDRPGHEIEYPLAVVIIGGLVTSTLLNLFVVPSLYLRFGGSRPQSSVRIAANG